MSFEECRIGDQAPKIQRSSCTPRRHCERWFWILCSIHWTRIFSILNDSRQDHGYHLQIAGLRWTSSRRSISLYPSKNGRCSQIIENFRNRNVQTYGFVYHDTNGQNHGPVWKTQSFLLKTKSVWSSSGRTIMGKAIWENPIEIRLGESFQLGMLIRTPWKRIILICVCGWHKIGWKNKTLIRCGKYSIKKLIWENQHLSWIMCTWDVLKDNVK